MQPVENAETRTTKRKLGSAKQSACSGDVDAERESSASAADEKDALINKLLERLALKDDQIATMMAKIDSLQTKLENLSDLLLKKPTESSTASTESNSDL